ncbi:MAG: type I restriction endonuclease subunit R, partial [Planctomycetes bacterium]|nr:type I restriction endonuclease subunit R [Planctomycetota bacterium]
MPVDHREIAFEDAIEHHLLSAGGYERGEPQNFERERAIDPSLFLSFVQETQPETWQALVRLHGADTADVVLDDLCKALDGPHGALAVIRHGFKCFGKRFHVAFFAPAHRMNPDTQRLYQANKLMVARQVHYSERHPQRSIDVMLSLNGIPVATAELKNPLTGQTVEHAKQQYKT